MSYQPKTGAKCHCRRGIERDNCPTCEGTGWQIDFAAIRARNSEVKTVPVYQLELTNNLAFFALSMGKVFRVTHILNTMEEANQVMERNRNVALIAEDKQGRCYLAEQYGAKCPSDLIIRLLT